MPDAAQRPTEPAAEAEEVSAAEPAFGALPGDPPVPEDAEIYRFLDEIRRAGPPPLSRTGSSSLTDALGVLSGSTTASPAVVPEQPWQSAVLPTSNAGILSSCASPAVAHYTVILMLIIQNVAVQGRL